MLAEETRKEIPPYIAWRTFANFLTELRAQGLPARVDRSVMAHKSGTIQSQLLLTLRYLGLIRASGAPSERLRGLIEEPPETRRRWYRQAVEEGYAFVFSASFPLQEATSEQMEELFRSTGASGETVRRSLAFFLALARAAGVSVSPYVRPHRKKRSRTPRRVVAPPPRSSRPAVSGRHGELREIRLVSGGTLRLELSLSLFDLEPRDRELVFSLIDRLRRYEEGNDQG